jgi:hypothetical protein
MSNISVPEYHSYEVIRSEINWVNCKQQTVFEKLLVAQLVNKFSAFTQLERVQTRPLLEHVNPVRTHTRSHFDITFPSAHRYSK